MQTNNGQDFSLISAEVEAVLRSVILPDLDRGRKDFDRPHTEAVVHWMKTLLASSELTGRVETNELNPKVLITAAYAHDWGYIGLFDGVDSNDPKVIAERKPKHMERGAELIRHLLESRLSAEFSTSEIDEVAALVLIHDRVEDLRSESEFLLMEADTLGMLDVDRVKPTFSAEANKLFLEKEIHGRRMKFFKHDAAKKYVAELAEKRRAFYPES